MMPGRLSAVVVTDRLAWIDQMLDAIATLPLTDRALFFDDPRNSWAAESCLRRALEALMDLGRHILARVFGLGPSEYKEMARMLGQQGVIAAEEAQLLVQLAGYRNRMVHFYHELPAEELFDVCSTRLSDVRRVTKAIKLWIDEHPDGMDSAL